MGKPRESQIILNTLTREEIIEDILDNIDGHIHVSPFLNESSSDEECIQITTDNNLEAHDLTSSELFHKWLSELSLKESNQKAAYWSCKFSETGVDFFLSTSSFDQKTRERSSCHDIQAVGHFCPKESVDYKSGLLSLFIQAQRVFINQPTRLFLRGLYLHGTLLEFWTFDRSGVYCTQTFSVTSDTTLLSSILRTFKDMKHDSLGYSDIVQQEGSNHFIRLKGQNKLPADRLYLKHHPIAFSEDIVGNGTTCYRARVPCAKTFDHVVKFKWCSDKKGSEEQFMRLAEERGAQGTVSLLHVEKLSSTAQLRDSLYCSMYSKFLDSTPPSSGESTGPGEKEKNASIGLHRGILGITEETQKAFEDRMLTVTVMTPVGRPLQSTKDPLELLQAIRDGVKAHRSLFQVARILHRDVSLGNIIIVTDPTTDGEPHGVLIDLDASIDVSETRGEPGHIIGTRPYMAIGVLLGRIHTYRHDLESFLYLLLRAALIDGNDNLPKASKLRMWTQGTFHQSAMQKMSHMQEANFPIVLAELPPQYNSFKPLADKMRQLLFPIEDGQLWTATDGSLEATNALYDGIIGAFDEAICCQKNSTSAIT